jgi:hypothetical protein
VKKCHFTCFFARLFVTLHANKRSQADKEKSKSRLCRLCTLIKEVKLTKKRVNQDFAGFAS